MDRIKDLSRGRSFHRVVSFFRNNWIFIAEIVITVLLCLVHCLGEGHHANFFPINGTFQNYNPVRRLFDGQIPYRDFQDYLGLGHLYLGSIFTVLFGGSYRSSLMAFSFLTFGSFALISYMVSFVVFRRKELSAALANIVLAVVLIQPLVLGNAIAGTSEIVGALGYTLGAGNSARLIRGAILPVVIFLMWSAHLSYTKIAERQKRLSAYKDIIICAGTGLIAGFGFTWSNDYGISCWICLFIMIFWVSLCRNRNLIKALLHAGIELAASFIGIFITVEIFTVGHFSRWFSATFGTGGYQSWYYNSDKSYYIYDVDLSYIMLIQAGLSIVYLIKLFMAHGTKEKIYRYGILAYANMVCFCAVNEYKLLSGNDSREVALVVLFLTVLYESINLFLKHQREKQGSRLIIVISVVVCFAWIISVSKNEMIFKYMTDKWGIPVEALGGDITILGNDLNEAEKFLDGENFFSTYASAQEVVNDSFQPSGTDYIIHVLGDNERENYLNAFMSGNFKYAATIRETYTPWEYWCQRANWFFYRELYRSWHPVYANAYEVYWERNPAGPENTVSSGYDIEVVDIDECSKKIIVKSDTVLNGIADVYIDADIEKKDRKSSMLVFQTMLKVENTGSVYDEDYEWNYLREDSREYIPIPIVNGYGEVTLTSCPERNTELTLNTAFCEQIFTVTSDFVQVSAISTDDSGRIIFHVLTTEKNRDITENIKSVEFAGKNYKVSEISEDDDFISVTTERTEYVPVLETGCENYLVLRR